MRFTLCLFVICTEIFSGDINVSWDEWKSYYDEFGGAYGKVETANEWHLAYQHNGLTTITQIAKDQNALDPNSDLYDFNNNYKNTSWTYYSFYGEVETADSNSLVIQDQDGNDLNYATVYTQDANGSDTNDANAVQTVVDF